MQKKNQKDKKTRSRLGRSLLSTVQEALGATPNMA